MPRIGSLMLLLLAALAPVRATILQQLSMDDMIVQSTGIVRARVTATYAAFRGRDIYTYYQLQVLETLKGNPSGPQIEVAVPGGSAKGLRQPVAGAPALAAGGEYVIFLWTSRSGLTQVIGLSQGLYRVLPDSTGSANLVRPATTETMLDKNGKVVTDQAVTLKWTDVRTHIRQKLGAGN